ncbi:unnamed protein product [Effrenium voratum]|nr:unnamed protein product [Effrenium voratum]
MASRSMGRTASTVGMMEGAFFVSRTELLQWVAPTRVEVGGLARAALRPLPKLEGGRSLRFSSAANWLSPGHLMVGRYPMLHGKESQGHLRQLVTEADTLHG